MEISINENIERIYKRHRKRVNRKKAYLNKLRLRDCTCDNCAYLIYDNKCNNKLSDIKEGDNVCSFWEDEAKDSFKIEEVDWWSDPNRYKNFANIVHNSLQRISGEANK